MHLKKRIKNLYSDFFIFFKKNLIYLNDSQLILKNLTDSVIFIEMQ